MASLSCSPSSSFRCSYSPIRRHNRLCSDRRLVSRLVLLTRRRQLRQVMEEIDAARRSRGKVDTVAMNAVLEACVHCRDVDSAIQVFDEMSHPGGCGVDNVSYAVLLKGLGEAGRIDEAFQLLELVEKGKAVGRPKLSGPLIFGLLNALVESGDLRRANGLLSQYGFFLREGGRFAVTAYNLLMKGYIKMGSPHDALAVHDELLRLELRPNKITYNTLIFACVKTNNLDLAMHFFEEMKDKAQKSYRSLSPDAVTYTTLLKCAGQSSCLSTVQRMVLEMKTDLDCFMDRTAYTATVDAFLSCGSIEGALCIFGEMLKLSGGNKDLRPKPHLYLSLMRAFSVRGDYNFVKKLHERILPDTSGTIRPEIQEEADHLLMEAALNNGQVAVGVDLLSNIITKWKGISWSSRGGIAALRLEAALGFTKSMLSPYLLNQVSINDRIENIMMPFEVAKPLHEAMKLRQVVQRFYTDSVVPIKDDWGSCVGLLHREDCTELGAPLWTMMRSPAPSVTTSSSIGHVVDLLIKKRYKMIIVASPNNSHISVGFFTTSHLGDLIDTVSDSAMEKPSICRTL